MSILLKMVKANLKLLIRSTGFLICLLLIPIGAASILMVQQTEPSNYEPDTKIVEVEENASIVSMSSIPMEIVAIDASQSESSELFLNSLSRGNIIAVNRYKTSETEREGIDLLAKSFYERGSVVAVIYLPADFDNRISSGSSPVLDVIKGREDGRINLVSSIIDQNITIMLRCAEVAKSNGELADLVEKAMDGIPEVQVAAVADSGKALSPKQQNSLSNIGYSIAILTFSFMLTGCFIANLVITERDNQTLLRVNMSGSSVMLYLLAKAITAIIMSAVQAGITCLAILLLIGTDIGIPFASYILFVTAMGLIFNLLCVALSMFSKNIPGVVYSAIGVWTFTNILSKVYFNFATFHGWMERLSKVMPQRWVMICSEMLMKNQSDAYTVFFAVFISYLLLIVTAGCVGAKLQIAES